MQAIDSQTIPISAEPSAPNQLQIQAQAIQAQREQYQRAVRQQAFANKLAVSTAIFQGLTMLSASALMLAIARFALAH